MFEKTEIYDYELPGHGKLYADPMKIRRGLLATSRGRLWEWAKAAKDCDKKLAEYPDTDQSETAIASRAEFSTLQSQLEGQIAEATIAAFGWEPVRPEDGFGVTEAVALQIAYDFLGWLEGKGERCGSPG